MGAVLLLAATAFAACDSGDDDDAPADPGAMQSATARAGQHAEFQDGTVRSGALGYSAELSDDWSILPTAVLPNGQQDTFTAEGETFPPTIQVRCLAPQAGTDAAASALTETARAHPEATPGGPRTIDGIAAQSLIYTAGQPPVEVVREDVIFSTPRCLWSVSLVTAPGQRDERLAEFEQFVSTFKPTP
jgi:hypothetical protein